MCLFISLFGERVVSNGEKYGSRNILWKVYFCGNHSIIVLESLQLESVASDNVCNGDTYFWWVNSSFRCNGDRYLGVLEVEVKRSVNGYEGIAGVWCIPGTALSRNGVEEITFKNTVYQRRRQWNLRIYLQFKFSWCQNISLGKIIVEEESQFKRSRPWNGNITLGYNCIDTQHVIISFGRIQAHWSCHLIQNTIRVRCLNSNRVYVGSRRTSYFDVEDELVGDWSWNKSTHIQIHICTLSVVFANKGALRIHGYSADDWAHIFIEDPCIVKTNKDEVRGCQRVQ